MLTVLSVAMLVAWWIVDVLIDKLEHRRGPTGSWLAAAALMALLAYSSVSSVKAWPYIGTTSLIAAGLAFYTIYWLRIRKH